MATSGYGKRRDVHTELLRSRRRRRSRQGRDLVPSSSHGEGPARGIHIREIPLRLAPYDAPGRRAGAVVMLAAGCTDARQRAAARAVESRSGARRAAESGALLGWYAGRPRRLNLQREARRRALRRYRVSSHRKLRSEAKAAESTEAAAELDATFASRRPPRNDLYYFSSPLTGGGGGGWR